MLDDKWLLWKFKHGSSDALCHIYRKYKNDLLALAIALSNNKTDAEDIVHDVFVSFAQSASELRLRSSLKSYLLTSIANRARNLGRSKAKPDSELDTLQIAEPASKQPEQLAISKENLQRVGSALVRLPYEQQEVIILHLQCGLRFKEIAGAQRVSANTIRSRYRYGLNKLRSILDGEVQK